MRQFYDSTSTIYTHTPTRIYMRRFTDKTGDCWVLHLSSCSTTLYICHYNDFIMNAMASRITGVSSVCSTVCSGADQRKHQSSASLTFVGGIHRWPVNSPHKWPVTRKIFPFMTYHGHRTRHRSTGLAYTLAKSYCQVAPYHPKVTLRWRHNDHAGVSNHQPHSCLLNRLFRRKSKKTSKLRVTGLCAGNSPGTGEFPAQMASYAENVSIWCIKCFHFVA